MVGILNFITFLLSIPILWAGIWLRNKGASECEKFLDTPVIVLGVFLLVVSLAGLIGACCGVSWLLWVYLVVMFLLIVVLFCFTILTFVVTNKGAGKVLSDRGYKEYRLGDYSNWLQKRVTSGKNWSKIKSCLIDAKICSDFQQRYLNDTLTVLYTRHLSALQVFFLIFSSLSFFGIFYFFTLLLFDFALLLLSRSKFQWNNLYLSSFSWIFLLCVYYGIFSLTNISILVFNLLLEKRHVTRESWWSTGRLYNLFTIVSSLLQLEREKQEHF